MIFLLVAHPFSGSLSTIPGRIRIWKVFFKEKGKTGVSGEKLLCVNARTNNRLSPPCFELRAQQWESSAQYYIFAFSVKEKHYVTRFYKAVVQVSHQVIPCSCEVKNVWMDDTRPYLDFFTQHVRSFLVVNTTQTYKFGRYKQSAKQFTVNRFVNGSRISFSFEKL